MSISQNFYCKKSVSRRSVLKGSAVVAAGFGLNGIKGCASALAPPPLEPRVIPIPEISETRSQSEIFETYGEPGDRSNIVKVPSALTLEIAWLNGAKRSHLNAHRLVADSLGSIMQAAVEEYGERELRRLRLNQFGGDLNVRKMKGADRWSLHSWGLAVDFDPFNNRYRWDSTKALFAGKEYVQWFDLWRGAGWYPFGPNENFDYMHHQAPHRRY